jgi:penicillin amidase
MRRRLTTAATVGAKGIAISAVAIALGIVAAYVYARRSLPDFSANATVDGLTAPIDIIRDADAVPHIFAGTRRDALFGLGYVHAQDRLWQMEFQRRIGLGRLSEVFGAATVPQDRFLRTVGFARAAREAWARMPEATRADVNAYVAGVNAFLSAHHGGALPPEFSLLRFEPEPWTGSDVVLWAKMMAWDLSSNYAVELLRDDLVRAVGDARMRQLMPPYAEGGLSIVQGPPGPASSAWLPPPSEPAGVAPNTVASNTFGALTTALSTGHPAVRDVLLGGAVAEGLGSNNWVVDGTMTASGKPLLANDPHLGIKAPSTWYLAHMSAGDFDVIGATLPGTAAVAIGRNRSIAWGMTNVAADVQDLYRERVDARGTSAMFRGVPEPITFVSETIAVKGGPPVVFDVRVTRHGPLVSDAINANNAHLPQGPRPEPIEPLALRWTALDPDDTTSAAFLALNTARDWTTFTTALRSFVVPSQNFVYADVEGHIGYYAPGRIPVRAHGDGAMPADGWTGDAEWTGWIPFEALPHLFDPPGHVIVTANQRPAWSGYPYMLGLEWPEPYRAARITALLHGRTRLTADDFAAIQADTVSLQARAVLPALLAHARPRDADDVRALDLLRRWDQDATGASAATAIFEAWFLRLAPTIAGDELGPRTLDSYAGRFSSVTRFLVNTLAADEGGWCDDTRTPAVETCDDAVTTALHAAVTDLTGRLGRDMTAWRWDAVHRATFPHQGLDAVRLLRPILSRSAPHGGDWSTVNVGTPAADRPFEQHSASGYREIIDLSPANDSRYLLDLGESGHPLSRHYDDFLQDWQAVKHRPMRMERADVEKGALGHLRLAPR